MKEVTMASQTTTKKDTKPEKVDTDKPKVHLFQRGSETTWCGIPIGNIVDYKEFSERPCSCCIAERLKKG